jgi:hypothetical protein
MSITNNTWYQTNPTTVSTSTVKRSIPAIATPRVRLDEGRPRILSFSLRHRRDAVLGEDPLDGGPPDVVAHIVHGVA